MDKNAIDTPSSKIDLSNIPANVRAPLKALLGLIAGAPEVRSPEELEKHEEQARAIADQFFDAAITPALEQAASSPSALEAAREFVHNLPRRMRSDGLETVRVRTSRGTTVDQPLRHNPPGTDGVRRPRTAFHPPPRSLLFVHLAVSGGRPNPHPSWGYGDQGSRREVSPVAFKHPGTDSPLIPSPKPHQTNDP